MFPNDSHARALAALRASIDAKTGRLLEPGSGSRDLFWFGELTRFNSRRGGGFDANNFAATCLACGRELAGGTEVTMRTLLLLGTVKSKHLLRSRAVLGIISREARAFTGGFTPGERAAQSRAFANLRCGDDPVLDDHVAALRSGADWLFDDAVAMLWALLLAGRDINSLLGDDILFETGLGGRGQFHRYRDLSHLRLMCGLKVPEEIEVREKAARAPQHTLAGSQSPLEEDVVEALAGIGLPFEQQVPIAGYSADFVVQTDAGPVVVEAMGLAMHYLSELRALALPEPSESPTPCCITEELRGEDVLRFRIYRKLGYRVLPLRNSDVPRRLDRRKEVIHAGLLAAV